MATNKSAASLVLILWVVFAFSSGCAIDLVTGKKSYNWFKIEEDIRLGQQVMDQQLKALKKKKKPVDAEADAVLTEKVQKITKRIGAVSHYPAFPYEAHLAKVDVVNAWCAPGGKVMVYTGLFDPKKGLVRRESGFAGGSPTFDDELAAVISHEIAHATARHVTEALSRNFTIMTIGTIAVSAISASGAGTVQNVFNNVIQEGINLYIPFYSRGNESEADRIGILYMAKAGYKPRAAVDLWYRACKKKGDMYSLYTSHPSSCQRAKNLEQLLPQAVIEYEAAKKVK